MSTGHGQLVDLSPEECWELLRGTPVGRIAWTTPDGPEVVPINLAVEEQTVLVRTAAYSALAQRVDAERVAVQVDHLDAETHTGWSVLARGVAEIEYGESREQGPEPWAAGTRRTLIAIRIDTVSGRRLLPPT